MANLSALTLEFDTTKGASIDSCAEEAVHIVEVLRVTVSFVFNDLRIPVFPGDDMRKVVARYVRAADARSAEEPK